MSEQLWYTWSTSGFGTANGFRVRAASANLTDIEGQRVRSFVNLARYKLSQDVDPFLSPQEAPLCLAFLKTDPGQESVLIQKTHSGPDGVGRPGAYFSHLVVNLPPVSSRSPAGQVPFSAREAIALWKSPLWKDKDSASTLPPGKRDLEQIPSAKLLSGTSVGPLTEQTVMQRQELFSLVMQAFLTLAVSGERKRLYLGGDPDTVASLIWGITHALPRTLNSMQEMTFSTFEADLESDARPLIVGTCWLPHRLKQGHEQALLDFPPQYYQSGNPYGIAINAASPQNHTPFVPASPIDASSIDKYVKFVLTCFSQGSAGMIELNDLLDEAEKRDVREMPAFLHLYVSFREKLPKEDVTRILQEMAVKAEAFGTRGEAILAQDKLDVLEMPPLDTITLAGEILKRDNVQRSLIHWMTQDASWWQSQGQPLVSRLYRLTYQYNLDALATLRDGFVQRIVNSRAWRRKEGEDLVGALLPYVQARAGATPVEVLSVFANSVTTAMQEAQNELVATLLPFTKKIIESVCLSIQRDDSRSTRSWTAILAICTERISTQAHTYLLDQFSGLVYTAAYEQWWQQYGMIMISRLYPVVRKRPGTELSQAFARFVARAAQELVAAIRMNDHKLLTFWTTVLDKATASAPATEPTAWAMVLTQLAVTPYTKAFERWWKESGKGAVSILSTLPPEQADSRLQEALTTFARKSVQELQTALKANEVTLLPLWKEMLGSVAPYQTRPVIWAELLNGLTAESLTQAFYQWWADQGGEATRALCQLMERTPQGPAYLSLTAFVRTLDEVLSRFITTEIREGQHTYETAIAFYLNALLDAVPAQQASFWLDQVQKLTNEFVHRSAGWSLRALLLEQWSKVPALRIQGSQPPLRLCLEPTWSELDAFLSLQIVDAWKKIAITRALETYTTTSNHEVVGIVKQQNRVFTEVLQDLIKAPQTRPAVIQFFQFLSQQNYVFLFDLLSDLLDACGSQQDITEQLLSGIMPGSARDVALLLERHCLDLLARAELSPTMLRLLTAYFEAFDVESLDNGPTQNLLAVLYQRVKSLPTDLQQSVIGWYAIAEFLVQPQSSRYALHHLSQSMRDMTRIVPDMQKKLNNKLTPRLVGLVHTEAELTRVLDNLGRKNEPALLQAMAIHAGEQYEKHHSPQRLAPFISMVLQECHQYESPEKEKFIDTCFQLLFKHVETRTRKQYWPEPLWAETLVEEWNSYLTRLGSADRERANALKQAISTGSVPNMINAFDPALESSLSAQERTIINLAFKFVKAYNTNDDAGMVEAHQALSQYRQARYTQDQVNRLKQAMAFVQQRQQQQELAEVAWRQQQQDLAEAAWRQQQAARLPHAAPAGLGNGSGSAEERGRREGTSYSPVQPQQQDQPALVDNQKAVAIVNSQSILEGWLQLAINIERIYLSNRQLHLQEDMQKVEDKKELKPIKKEAKDIGNLINDVVKLRTMTLDELIDDMLIQEEIGKIRANDAVWRALESEMEGKIVHLHKELATVPASINSPLRSTEKKDVQEIRTVLAVFIRRELFEKYLKQARQLTMGYWLKMQREYAQITVNNAHASKRGGLWLFGQ